MRPFSLVLTLALVSGSVAAQPTSGCGALLETAQDHYTNQRFREAEQAVSACLERPTLSADDALDAYRLLALVHLRQDDLAGAKQAVIRLLDLSFDYEPDQVLDPPTYVALVGTIRDQLRVVVAEAPPQTPAVEPEGTAETEGHGGAAHPAPTPPLRPVHVGVSLGAGSYSGERGIDGGSLTEEFRLNGGFSFAVDGSYAFRDALSAVVSYRAVHVPLLLTNDVRPEDVHVRPDESSAWVHVLTLLARAHIGPEMRATPYVQAGVSTFFTRLNRETRVGVGPQAGVGVDLAVTPGVVGFAEVNFAVSLPGDAVDRVSSDGAVSDLLTFLGVGLRYEVATP